MIRYKTTKYLIRKGGKEDDCYGLLGRQGSTPQGAGALSPQEAVHEPETSNPPEEKLRDEPKLNPMDEMRRIRESWSEKKTGEVTKKKKAGKKTPDVKKKKEEPKKMNLILEMWKKRDLEGKLEKSKEVEHTRKETRLQESPQVNIVETNPPRARRGREAEDQELRKEDLEGEQEIRKQEADEEKEAEKKEPEGEPAIQVELSLAAGIRRNQEGREARKTEKERKEDLEGDQEIRKQEATAQIDKEKEAEKKESEGELTIQVELSLDAGIRRNQEGREARKTEKKTEIKEGSRVRNRETETGTIPKVKLDLDPGKNEKEERRGLQEWSRIGLGRKRKAEEQEDMVLRKYKARPRKIKEGLDLQQKTERDNKVSSLISRFNFSSSSRVGQGEARGGGGVVRDRAGHGDNSGSARDKRVLGEHPHSTTSTGPRIGRVGERKYLAESTVFEGQGDRSESSPVCTGTDSEICDSTTASTASERAHQCR